MKVSLPEKPIDEWRTLYFMYILDRFLGGPDLYGRMILPPFLHSGKKYPVLVNVWVWWELLWLQLVCQGLGLVIFFI